MVWPLLVNMAGLWEQTPPGIKSIMDDILENLDALHAISEKWFLLEKERGRFGSEIAMSWKWCCWACHWSWFSECLFPWHWLIITGNYVHT